VAASAVAVAASPVEAGADAGATVVQALSSRLANTINARIDNLRIPFLSVGTFGVR
jgi:hypothetical protein